MLWDRPAEAGALLRLHYNGRGVLDGFVEWVERAAAKAYGSDGPINEDRSGPDAVGQGVTWQEDGRILRQDDGHEFGFGDLMLALKTELADWGPPGMKSRLAGQYSLLLQRFAVVPIGEQTMFFELFVA
jgi:hypothetical protein